ncbi:MAG: PKD domain-containing protein [Chloroflexi bacterium]|nr:PKD domain-containing protein [Chloroflexota bacterium]
MLTISRTRVIVFALILFVAGAIAGSGIGIAYGTQTDDAVTTQRIAELQNQRKVADDKYNVLIAEYNKVRTAPVAPAVKTVAPTPTSMPTATVPATAAPVADFGSDKVEARPESQIKFRDDSNGKVTAWLWDFGDGTTSTEQNPAHAYKEVGKYTVTLKVTGPGGSDTIKRMDYIRISEDCDC